MMKALAPLFSRGVSQVKDHLLYMLARMVGCSSTLAGESSGEKHSRTRDERPSSATVHFNLGTSGSTGRASLMYDRVQIATAMI